MKPIDFFNHMREIGTWVKWPHSIDGFITGDRESEVKGIAVVWQARTSALKKAVELGCNLIITHEQAQYFEQQICEEGVQPQCQIEKFKFAEEHGLVILRNHDVWDRMPKVGIVDSWGEHLGLGEPTARGDVENVYASPAPTLHELAKYVLDKTRDLRQDSVEMVGDPNAKVTKVGIGCGAGTDYRKMAKLGADAVIGSDDGMHYWGDGSWALDSGIPLVLVTHCVSEEPGMKNLAAYLRKLYPDVKVEYVLQGPLYSTVC